MPIPLVPKDTQATEGLSTLQEQKLPVNLRQIDVKTAQEIASRLTLLKNEAMRAQLYRTAHLIEIPIQEIGWEMQGIAAPDEQKARQQSLLTRVAFAVADAMIAQRARRNP